MYCNSFLTCVLLATCAGASGQQNTLSTFQTSLVSSSLMRTITLNGNASWTVGSLHETGTAKLQAGVDGSAIVQLMLNTASRTDAMTGVDQGRTCLWSDKAGTTHEVVGANCLVAIPWFAPALLSQNQASLPSLLRGEDHGITTRDGAEVHELDLTLKLAGQTDTLTQQMIEASRVKVFYDPKSLTATSLEYSVFFDGNDVTRLPVRVLFSDYRTVSGVLLPFHIDRYVQKSLQLSLDISNASIE